MLPLSCWEKKIVLDFCCCFLYWGKVTKHTLHCDCSSSPIQEFAENLLGSGVHGAVMVLDPSFNCDAMATALGIPNNKHMVRRHLVEEMKMLIESDR